MGIWFNGSNYFKVKVLSCIDYIYTTYHITKGENRTLKRMEQERKGFLILVLFVSKSCGLIYIQRENKILTNCIFKTIQNTMTVASDSAPQFTVYKRRWYILLIFSLHAMFQCTLWNTWGPVETVALAVFKSWTMADISNFANWGEILLIYIYIY